MTYDYKRLCAELVDDLELCDWPYKLKETIRADINRARAALAEPDTAGPTDEELLQVFDTVCLSEGGTVDEIHLRGLHAVLARWGKYSDQLIFLFGKMDLSTSLNYSLIFLIIQLNSTP